MLYNVQSKVTQEMEKKITSCDYFAAHKLIKEICRLNEKIWKTNELVIAREVDGYDGVRQ